MRPKLRAVLRDRILLLLMAALLVQSYRVADRDEPSIDLATFTPSYTYSTPPIVDYEISLGWQRIEVSNQRLDEFNLGFNLLPGPVATALGNPKRNELNVSFVLPLGPDGRPMDMLALSQQDSAALQKVYMTAEFAYGTDDSRTLKARAAYASNLLYRGDRDEALRLLRQNYDAAIDASDMALDERLSLLLFSARELRAFGDDKHGNRLTRLVPLAQKHWDEAPRQVGQILNAIASLHLEGRHRTTASAYLGVAEALPLDPNKDKLVIIETGLGLAAARYASGSTQIAREKARRQLPNVASLQDKELLPAREAYLNALRTIFETLGDDEYVAITKRLQAGRI